MGQPPWTMAQSRRPHQGLAARQLPAAVRRALARGDRHLPRRLRARASASTAGDAGCRRHARPACAASASISASSATRPGRYLRVEAAHLGWTSAFPPPRRRAGCRGRQAGRRAGRDGAGRQRRRARRRCLVRGRRRHRHGLRRQCGLHAGAAARPRRPRRTSLPSARPLRPRAELRRVGRSRGTTPSFPRPGIVIPINSRAGRSSDRFGARIDDGSGIRTPTRLGPDNS